MDVNPQDIITALPDESVLKTALTAIGTNIDTMQSTDELFLFVNAYEQAQTEFNSGTLPETINTVGVPVISRPVFDSQGTLSRTITRTLTFNQSYEIEGINPFITF